jgi:hypothetical protein
LNFNCKCDELKKTLSILIKPIGMAAGLDGSRKEALKNYRTGGSEELNNWILVLAIARYKDFIVKKIIRWLLIQRRKHV